MENVLSFAPARTWREFVQPKEHGSWSLALEPLALGLLVAPSLPGTLFSLAVIAAFFARRPLRIAFVDAHSERRAAAQSPLLLCGFFATALTGGAVALGGV